MWQINQAITALTSISDIAKADDHQHLQNVAQKALEDLVAWSKSLDPSDRVKAINSWKFVGNAYSMGGAPEEVYREYEIVGRALQAITSTKSTTWVNTKTKWWELPITWYLKSIKSPCFFVDDAFEGDLRIKGKK
jgi:hypothetical protein